MELTRLFDSLTNKHKKHGKMDDRVSYIELEEIAKMLGENAPSDDGHDERNGHTSFHQPHQPRKFYVP